MGLGVSDLSIWGFRWLVPPLLLSLLLLLLLLLLPLLLSLLRLLLRLPPFLLRAATTTSSSTGSHCVRIVEGVAVAVIVVIDQGEQQKWQFGKFKFGRRGVGRSARRLAIVRRRFRMYVLCLCPAKRQAARELEGEDRHRCNKLSPLQFSHGFGHGLGKAIPCYLLN